MRHKLLCNNRVGWLLADWLKPQGEEITGPVLHPEGKRKLAVEIFRHTTSFPMEMFLLMEMNCVYSPELGTQCHQQRVTFELAIPSELRRKLYESLAVLCMGQECILLARVRA